MFDYLYKWIQNAAFYLILVTTVMQLVPNEEYKKYIRFFTGLVLVLMLLGPLLKLFGEEDALSKIYSHEAYEEQMKRFEQMQEEILQPEMEKEEQNIEVGEIRID